MEILYKNKGIILSTLLFIAVLWTYNLFTGGKPLPTPGSIPTGGLVDNELVNIANELSAITFETDLFRTSGYRFLTDFSVPLPQGPSGRANPFDSL